MSEIKISSSFLNLLSWPSLFLILLAAAAAAAKSLQSCPTLCDPIDCSPPGSPIPGILQARTQEWVAISSSNAWKWKVKVKSLSRAQIRDPMDCSLPGSSIHGVFQARVLEWVAVAYCHHYSFDRTVLSLCYFSLNTTSCFPMFPGTPSNPSLPPPLLLFCGSLFSPL